MGIKNNIKNDMIRSVLIDVLLAFVLALPVDYVIAGMFYAHDSSQSWGTKSALVTIGFTAIVLFIIWQFVKRIPAVRARILEFDLRESIRRSRKDFVQFYQFNAPDSIVLSVSLLVGFALRIAGYNWGLVASWQPDEGKLVSPAIMMADARVLFTDVVYYPDQFVSKLAAIVIYIYSRLTGTPMDHETMAEAYFLYRVLVAILGTATIYTAFLIGNHIKKHVGAAFALLVAIYPYYVCYAKQVTGDVTACFFLSITMLCSLRYFKDGRYRSVILMAMGAAMATLEKWHGAIGIGYIGLVLLFSNKGVQDFIKKGFLAITSWYLWMFLLAPNIMIHPKRAIIDGFIKIAVYDGAKGAPYYVHLIDYLKYGYRDIGGIMFLLLVLIGVYIVCRYRSVKYTVLLCGVLKILVISVLNQDGARWAMELYFSELLLISVALASLLECSAVYVRWIALAAASVIFLELASSSMLVSAVAYHTDQDSRIIQRRACVAAGITPDNAISQYYSGFGPTSWCDSEYPGTVTLVDNWNDYVTEIDGELYRTSDRYDYICLDLSRNSIDMAMAEKLDSCQYDRLFEYHPCIRDVFSVSFLDIDATANDFKRIKDSVKVIRDLHDGALSGDEIIVYDISGMKVIDQEYGQ